MGTDVFLSWNNITEEEKESQFQGDEIRIGYKGYLRAAIGNILSNDLLSANPRLKSLAFWLGR